MLEYGADRGFRSKAIRKTQVRLGETNAGRAAWSVDSSKSPI